MLQHHRQEKRDIILKYNNPCRKNIEKKCMGGQAGTMYMPWRTVHMYVLQIQLCALLNYLQKI